MSFQTVAKLKPINYNDDPEIWQDLNDHRFPPGVPLSRYPYPGPETKYLLVSGEYLHNGKVKAYDELRSLDSIVGSAERVQSVYEHPKHGLYVHTMAGPFLVVI